MKLSGEEDVLIQERRPDIVHVDHDATFLIFLVDAVEGVFRREEPRPEHLVQFPAILFLVLLLLAPRLP